jgi:hypothetical protein
MSLKKTETLKDNNPNHKASFKNIINLESLTGSIEKK